MTACRWGLGFALVFFVVGLVGVNAAFTSASHERQYQTIGIGQSLLADAGATVWRPRAPFGHDARPELGFTVVRLEFPFHAALGATLARVTGEAPWVWRSVSIIASIITILLATIVFFHFAPRGGGVIGTAVFCFSPLLLHYGQVPMPDIMCTLGMVASFAAACLLPHASLAFRVLLSALAFAIALLGKPSILPFALPICAFLFVSDDAALEKRHILYFGLWCALALTPVVIWILGSFGDPPESFNLFTVASSPYHKGFPGDLRDPMFYVRVVSYLTIFGLGPFGVLMAVWGVRGARTGNTRRLAIAVFVSCVATYLGLTRFMWREPQYSLPIVFWLSLFAAAGWARRPRLLRANGPVVVLGICHLIVVGWATMDLKADRIPYHRDIQNLESLIDDHAKVLQVSLSYGATASGLLHRRTLAYGAPTDVFLDLRAQGTPRKTNFEESLKFHRDQGYSHLLFWDYTLRGNPLRGDRRVVRARDLEPELWDFAHARLRLVRETEHVSLFALPRD